MTTWTIGIGSATGRRRIEREAGECVRGGTATTATALVAGGGFFVGAAG